MTNQTRELMGWYDYDHTSIVLIIIMFIISTVNNFTKQDGCCNHSTTATMYKFTLIAILVPLLSIILYSSNYFANVFIIGNASVVIVSVHFELHFTRYQSN